MITKTQQSILSKLPAKQNELWKSLNINKRNMSKIVIAMQKAGLITRKKISSKGITTYLIQKNVKVTVYNPTRISQLNPKYKTLFNDRKEFSPCTGCIDYCKPVDCGKLVNWIM